MAVIGDPRRAAGATPSRLAVNGRGTGLPIRSVPFPAAEQREAAAADLTAMRTLVEADLALADARLTAVRTEAADLLADAVDQASLIVRGTDRTGREIVRAAQDEADRIRSDAEERARRTIQEAEEQARAASTGLPQLDTAEPPRPTDSGLEEAVQHLLQLTRSLAQLQKRRERELGSELFAVRLQASREITARLVEFDRAIEVAWSDVERELARHRRAVHRELAVRVHTVRDRLAVSLQTVRLEAQAEASAVLQQAQDQASALLAEARAASAVYLQRADEEAESLLADARRRGEELWAAAADERAAATRTGLQAETELAEAHTDVASLRSEASEMLRTARAEADVVRSRARLAVEQARAEASEAKQLRRRLETEIQALMGVIDGLAVAGRPATGRSD